MTWRTFDGRSGLRGAAHRRLRVACVDVAGVRLPVIANIVGGLIAVGLLVYLFIALLRPERF
jgi:K+-transporting ATPase KdpF subunit